MSIGEIYLSQVYKVNTPNNANKSQKATQTKSMNTVITDGLDVSELGSNLNTARKAIKQTDDIRQDLVDDIKARFKAGKYEVSTSAIADKLLGLS